MEDIFGGNGRGRQGLQLRQREQSVVEDAGGSSDRVLREQVHGHNAPQDSQCGIGASGTGQAGDDRLIPDAQGISILGWLIKKSHFISNKGASGHEKTVWVFPVPDCITGEFLDNGESGKEQRCHYVKPDNVREYS